MTASFLTGAYKVHRENVLLDMERARLPESQEDALRFKNAKQLVESCRTQVREIIQHYMSLPSFVRSSEAHIAYKTLLREQGWSAPATKKAFATLLNAEESIREQQQAMFDKIRVIKCQKYRDAKTILERFGLPLPEPTEDALERRVNASRNDWTFVMKCTNSECEGFVGSNWKCGLCLSVYCRDCREITCSGAEGEHVCNEEKRLTIAALQKEAKPCPKCAAMISKISGCDQMWCTQCRTAFSWRTGTIEESHVHNPHYFEWMRRNGALAPVPHHLQIAVPGGNGECWGPLQIQHQLLRSRGMTERPDVTSAWIRMIRHYEWDTRRLRQGIRNEEEERRIMRVKRLVGELNDTSWKIKLQRVEKARNKRLRICQVLETFTQAAMDIMREFLNIRPAQSELYQQLDDLEMYCNIQFQRIASRYKNDVPYLNHTSYILQGWVGASVLLDPPHVEPDEERT